MSAELMKSKFVRRPCRNYLWTSSGFLSNFSCWMPWAVRSNVFWIFEKHVIFQFFTIFPFSLTWDFMGAKVPKATPPSNRFSIFRNFFRISSQRSFQKLCFGFFLKFWVSDFSGYFARKLHVRHCNIYGSHYGTVIISKRSHRRAERSEIWTLCGGYQCMQGCFRHLSVQCQSEVIRCISNFRQPCVSKTAGRRANENLMPGVQVFTVYGIPRTVKCSRSVCGSFGKSPAFDNLASQNGWSKSKTDQNLGLGSKCSNM